jgi:outer membrane protein OmpA-like peptidoglycan-associated protein
MEGQLGADFGQVRVHTDDRANEMAQAMGANAFTSGNDIYFNRDRYAPEAPGGRRLLAHELTHVVQQDGDAGGQVQFDLMQSLPTALGGFEINMATRNAPQQPGMEGHIRFSPDPNGPYSAQIGLVQAVNTTDVGGRTTSKPGKPLDWTKVGGGESGRMDLMTTGEDTAPEGWFIDAQTAANAPGSDTGPNYIEQWGITSPSARRQNYFGWLRSPTDWRETSLWDYPTSPIDLDFEFETVAKATDTQTVYGALEWGFGVRSGVVQNEYVQAFDAESAVFNEALERFRGYYTHEPIVIYFDTGQDIPLPGEEDKISGVMDYLNRYPDVMVQIEGFADERGRPAMNDALSERRALNVQNLMMLHGLDSSRVDFAIGWGETQEFAAGRDEGTWRANRRVVVSFQRTASTPIVMP